ncbi:general stress protein [Priestia aryabhattai]|uniref:general stress protein n=1 Tax=Priestia aryabhattai TaxID=412384 RepID=UPI00209AED80|nr:general stress protein [Priestia aryabhattai]
MTKNVIGTYDNEEALVTAIQHLKTQGFQEKDLSLVTSKDIDEEDCLEVESKEGIDVKKGRNHRSNSSRRVDYG